MLKKHKKYKKPRKKFDLDRIKQENEITKRYGLKNKKEIWKADAEIGRMRKRAKTLITKTQEEQEKFINKLKKGGFKVSSISDILALSTEDVLRRRLQSIVSKKKNIPVKSARQLIVHKHISVEGKKINIPSYKVPADKEDKIEITVKMKIKKEKENKNG